MTRVAVIGIGCRYPDAASPQELWENVLAGRRAFRTLPAERMSLEDYWSADPAAPDRFYSRNAAVIEGYEFDRLKFKIAGSTYRSTDLTHWLALDVAAQAFADAGFPAAEGLPRERTGVIVGNTLTGEFTRANLMRLRWPYVRRTLAAALKEQGWDDERLVAFLDTFERSYKAPFPEVNEDTLAGGLSNTIAGRICNYFDLKGGGYTVDGACSSSLLSVATACKALVNGELDVAIAGGVDLSIDPFEIIGFAKTGALARGEMRLYDRDSNGFWPGEGCGMVVLMREDDASAAGHRVYTTVAGWGISSDGKGGITRPEVSGYRLALQRAYEQAGFGVDTVPVFEGHGTGTQVGDAAELKALSLSRRAADPGAPAAAISSIKGMIGHTKAAAGVAGLIKAAMAVHHQVVPPTTGCVNPHQELTGERPALRVLRKAESWPEGAPLRVGVTAMGFGGINTHLVLEGAEPRRPGPFDAATLAVASSVQDAELLLFDAAGVDGLRAKLDRVRGIVPHLAYAELADLATVLQRELNDHPYRAAVVVSSPDDAERKIAALLDALDEGRMDLFHPDGGILLGHSTRSARVGYLFPGQGSGRGFSGGAIRRRFTQVEEVFERAALPNGGDLVATAIAQPRIVTGSMAGLRALTMLGLDATVAIGHSLGEITALHHAGALSEEMLLRVAAVRGAAMTEHSESGTMASIGAAAAAVEPLLAGEPVVIAGYNSTVQTAVAGPAEAVRRVCERAAERGLGWTGLPVSHAFHSPLVAPAAAALAERLATETFGPVARRVISTVTGDVLMPDTDIHALLRRQITDPVRFAPAVSRAAAEVDLFVEVGPGRVLTGLVRATTDVPAVAMDTDEESLAGFLTVIGAAYVKGAAVDHGALFAGRFARPLELDARRTFFANPCEAAPEVSLAVTSGEIPADAEAEPVRTGGTAGAENSLELLLRLAAERVELPVDAVDGDSRPLDDLHLSSITVGQLMNQAARELGLPAVQAPPNVATANLRELADTLDAMAGTALPSDMRPATMAAGVAPWVRPFVVEMVEEPLPARVGGEGDNGVWRLYAPAGHPIAEPLRRALETGGVGPGVLVCLPSPCDAADLEIALLAAKAAVSRSTSGRLVLVQHGRGASGLVKTARLEAPDLLTTIVDTPPNRDAIDHVLAEVAATTGFVEAHYDDEGVRRVPVLRLLAVDDGASSAPLDGGDVLLVTGGGKGITAECALALAAGTRAGLAILGRSDPAEDTELSANLDRMRAAGVPVRYVRADVTDAASIRAAVARIRETLGPVTGVLYGAGRNEPAALTNLEMPDLLRTLAPKADGLRAVLDAVDPDALKLLVTFGSIIGRAGLRGQADYATANDWLADLTRRIAREHPRCRAVCLEWSVWSGVGMGERLAVVESLMRDGVTPITPDKGVEALLRLVADPGVPPVVVVTGRAEGLDTIRYERPDLPLLRFVERPLVHYPGVELVTEVELTPGTDLYLDDHRLDDNLLFPAVIGMEAMAQCAGALCGREDVPVIERAEFSRPIVVPVGGTTTIRIAVQVTGDQTVEAVIRSGETDFAADHFRATLSYGAPAAEPAEAAPPGTTELPPIPLDPARDLYGETLFQGKRFQRLVRYRKVAARHTEADVVTADDVAWFSTFLPNGLRLGDPGARDALMHGIQVCVPDATLLPVGVDRIQPGIGEGELTFTAIERFHDGDTYVYDIVVRDESGKAVERWDGLRLRAVRRKDGAGPWVPALLGPFLQRHLADAIGADVAVAVEPDLGKRRRENTAVAVGRAIGHPVDLCYRPDGRPEIDGGLSVSVAHGAGITLAVADNAPLGCDVEPVVARGSGDWADLLGRYRPVAELLAAETGDSPALAATRVWCAIECLQKAGESPGAVPLDLQPRTRAGWSVLTAGDLRIATFATSLRDVAEPVVLAVLAKGSR